MKHAHTFTCPVFALQNALASGKSLPRWSPCTRLGLNLGPSPTHASNVYLVLNLMTGCISPQYHCQFDDFFEMTHCRGPDDSDTSYWQQLAELFLRGTNSFQAFTAYAVQYGVTSNSFGKQAHHFG
jgi:hypothetical protein